MTVCKHCHGASMHQPIPGEGTPVCISCVWRLGRAAADVVEQWRDLERGRLDRRLREMFGWSA